MATLSRPAIMAAQCDMFTASQTRNAKAAELGRLERGRAEAWAAREANQLTAREKDEAERIEQARKEAAAEAEERHHREWAEAIHREDNARIRHRIKCEIAAAMASLPQPIASKTAAEALVVRGVPNTTVRF